MEDKKTSIVDKIEELYNLKDENGKQKNKAFFAHLIRSYMPLKSVSVAEKEPIKEPEKKKQRVHCVFTHNKLITVQKAIEETKTDSFKRNVDEFLKSFDSERGFFTSTIPMGQLLKGRVLALQGKNTKTYMSQESYLAFVGWVMNKYLAQDKDIIWLLNKMTNNPFHPGIAIKKKKKKVMHQSTGAKKSTFGDLEAFKKLKDKFKD
jgi:hypothetical protein